MQGHGARGVTFSPPSWLYIIESRIMVATYNNTYSDKLREIIGNILDEAGISSGTEDILQETFLSVLEQKNVLFPANKQICFLYLAERAKSRAINYVKAERLHRNREMNFTDLGVTDISDNKELYFE